MYWTTQKHFNKLIGPQTAWKRSLLTEPCTAREQHRVQEGILLRTNQTLFWKGTKNIKLVKNVHWTIDWIFAERSIWIRFILRPNLSSVAFEKPPCPSQSKVPKIRSSSLSKIVYRLKIHKHTDFCQNFINISGKFLNYLEHSYAVISSNVHIYHFENLHRNYPSYSS